MHKHAQRAFESVVLLLAHVVDLLRDRDGVDFGESAVAQQLCLTHRPGIEVALFRRRPFQPVLGQRLGPSALSFERSQLSATFSALSGSSWPKQRW